MPTQELNSYPGQQTDADWTFDDIVFEDYSDIGDILLYSGWLGIIQPCEIASLDKSEYWTIYYNDKTKVTFEKDQFDSPSVKKISCRNKSEFLVAVLKYGFEFR